MTTVIGAVPPEEALRALRTRGAAPFGSFDWEDVSAEEHRVGFTVAKSAGFDVVTDIVAAVQKQVAEGQSIPQAIAEIRPILEAKGWWGRKEAVDPLTGEARLVQLGSVRRLETIFGVNARVSYAAGHWARFEAQKTLRPYLRYVAILDGRTRPQHALWHNVCLPVDHPWWDTHAPPNGWNCRCTLQSLTARDVERMADRLKREPPTETTRAWTNRRTGEVTELPDGIDPGWGHNPGKAGARAAARNSAVAETMADAPHEISAVAVISRVMSDDFRRFTSVPEGTMPVMAVREEVGRALGTDVRVALLSADTMRKQIRHHPELTVEDYRALPELGTDPTAVIQDGETTVVLVRKSDGRWRIAALKVTASRKAAFVTSFRYADAADVLRIARRGTIIYGRIE